ncbi:MAG: class IV adenylate cyclase [Planctomycetaceae bacterium]
MADYEVEMKFPLPSTGGVLAKLEGLGALPIGSVAQRDRYFAHPTRDFGRTDEAFRIRTSGEKNCVTYKGPLLDRTTKTRQEIEINFESGSESAHRMWAMLRALGFEEVRTVEKSRQQYELKWGGREFTLAIDTVKHLGDYIEIETMAQSNDWEQARDTTLALAELLQLGATERRSYLQILLEQEAS